MAQSSERPAPTEHSLDVLGDYLEPSLDLLKFYRSKITGFEAEREEFIRRLVDVEAQNAELHRLRWELRARDDEVRRVELWIRRVLWHRFRACFIVAHSSAAKPLTASYNER